ncbi:hypothetical protein ZWY2020_017302 [Hordeum vulgare]|nr:hypothetical protein ZWY2020_017302 [Hordeum vulgare]
MDLDLPSCCESDTLFKFAVFVLVQALVYLILSQSSDVFSGTRSLSFRRPARSASLRRMVTQLLTEMPAAAGGEPSSPAARQQDGGSSGGDVDVDLEIELMLIGCSFSS